MAEKWSTLTSFLAEKWSTLTSFRLRFGLWDPRGKPKSTDDPCSRARESQTKLYFLCDRSQSSADCTKIAHRRPLAIFTADEGIAGNSATRTIFNHFLRRRNRGSLAIFFAEEIAHLALSLFGRQTPSQYQGKIPWVDQSCADCPGFPVP